VEQACAQNNPERDRIDIWARILHSGLLSSVPIHPLRHRLGRSNTMLYAASKQKVSKRLALCCLDHCKFSTKFWRTDKFAVMSAISDLSIMLSGGIMRAPQ